MYINIDGGLSLLKVSTQTLMEPLIKDTCTCMYIYINVYERISVKQGQDTKLMKNVHFTLNTIYIKKDGRDKRNLTYHCGYSSGQLWQRIPVHLQAVSVHLPTHVYVPHAA